MARYPTFEEYEKTGNFDDGVKRCDELLQKSPDDIQLLVTKYRLLASTDAEKAIVVLEQVVSLSPPNQDPSNIAAIEDGVTGAQQNLFPPISTAGPLVAKLWEKAVKQAANMNRKLDLISTRWERAVFDSRVTDMQQTLIQLKAIQPKNRVVYMAHAALTQMLSTSTEDLQARLALGLARKAVTDRFDEDNSLDCRVPGQIFAMQQSEKDLETIKDRPFRESKQVFDAMREKPGADTNGTTATSTVPEPSSVPSHEWLSAEISELQQRFARLVASQAPRESIHAFASNAIRLFHAAKTSLSTNARRSPADACFLAASALVRLSEQTHDTQYLLHAAYLSESLLRHNEHIHEARLVLVYLYMRLGLGSLAMRLFDSLNIKEVQYDTIGHVLFTRLSLLHPQPTTLNKKETFDPLKRTAQALSFYVRCEEKLAETEASVLSHGQTGMLFELHELRDTLRKSQSRRVTSLEWRRITRLTKNKAEFHPAIDQMGPQVIRNWTETKDNRDFNAAFDYGFNVERALHSSNKAILPGEAWILFSLAADMAWSIATGDPAPVIDMDGVWNLTIDEIKSKADASASPHNHASRLGLTSAEYLAGDLAHQSLKILISLRPAANEQDTQEAITATASAVEALNIDTLTTTPDSLTERLLDHYAYADVLRILIVACTFAAQRAPDHSEELNELQTRAQQLFRSLQKHATEQQARMKTAGVRKLMEQDGGVWQALEALGNQYGELDGFCDEVARSAKEGWEGVGKIKLV